MKVLVMIMTIIFSSITWSQDSKIKCQIEKVNACPVGTYSYSCNGKFLYQVTCMSLGKRFVEVEDAKMYKMQIERDLNACVGY